MFEAGVYNGKVEVIEGHIGALRGGEGTHTQNNESMNNTSTNNELIK